MSDVLFTGNFDLDAALASFNRFATTVETRLKTMSGLLAKSGGASPQATKEMDAELKRQQKITDQHLAYKIAQAKKAAKLETDIKTAELKRQTKEELEERKRQERITREHLAYNIAQAKKQTKSAEEEAAKQAEAYKKIFVGLTVGGFALQRFGQFLTNNVSVPLQNVTKQIYATIIAVDNFEQTLSKRANKSKSEIEEIYKTVKKVSDLPNLEREDVLTIFSRIEEVTQGGITAQELEKIGAGLSKITTSLEAGEKRAFYGQLQDILGGGDVANLEKTLSLVPLLKSKFDQLKESATVDKDDKTLILEALSQLAQGKNIDNLETKVKRIRNEIFEFRRRLGELYKDVLQNIVEFLLYTAFPVIDKLLVKLEGASATVQTLVASLVGLSIVLPYIINTFGALGIAVGGIGFAVQELTGLSILGAGGLLSKLPALLATLPALLNPVTIAIAAIVAALAALAYYNVGGFGDAIQKLGNTLKDSLITQLTSLVSILGNLVEVVGLVVKLSTQLNPVLGVILAFLADFVGLLTFVSGQGIKALADLLQFIVEITSEGFAIAWERLNLRILESAQAFQEIVPGVAKLSYWIASLFSNNTKTIEQLIDRQKQKIKELGGEIEGEKKLIDKLGEAHNDWDVHIENTAKRVAALTVTLNAQSQAMQDVIDKSTQTTGAARDKGEQQAYSDDVSRLRREAMAMDLSNPAQAAAALRKLQEAGRLNIEAAQIVQQQKRITGLSSAYATQRAEIVSLAEKETDATLKALYGAILKAYDSQPDAIKLGLTVQGLIAQLGDPRVDQRVGALSKAFAVRTQGLYALKQQLDAEKDLDLGAAQRDNANALREYKEAVEEIAAIRAEMARKAPLYDQLGTAEARIKSLEEQKSLIAKEKDAILSMTDLWNELSDIMEKLKKAEEEKYAIELQIIEAGRGKQIDKEKAKDELNRKYSERKGEIGEEGTKIFHNTVQELIKSQGENSRRLRSLITSFGDELKANIELMVELATHGVEPDLNRLNRAVEAYNKTVSQAALTLVTGAVNPLVKTNAQMYKFGQLEGVKNVEGIDTYFKFISKFQMASHNVHPLTKEEIDALLIEAQGVANFLRILGSMDSLSTNDQADLALITGRVLASIENLKAARETMKDTKDIGVENLRVKEALQERELRINDNLRTQLELEQEILNIRRDKAYDQDLPTLSKIWAVISGSQRAAQEAQLRIIENEMVRADIEMNLAITRLELEQKIYLLRLKELGATDEELKKAKEMFDMEIEQIRRKNKLEKELLEEKKGGIKDTLSGGGGLLGAIFGSIFGKKKKKLKTGDVDADGNIIVTDDEEGIGGLPPIVSDEDADNTTGNIDDIIAGTIKLGGALGKTIGLIGGLSGALAQMNDLSIKGILKVLAAELKALAIKAAIKALEYAAYAAAFAVFGDFHSAGKALAAAAMWGVVAAAAGGAAALLGAAAGDSAANAQSSASRAAGVPDEDTYDPDRDKVILKQKALSVLIQLDIRTDDGIIIKKNIKALNANSELTNLTLNSQEGWAVSPSP